MVKSSATSVSGLMRGMKRVRYHSSPFEPDESEARQETRDERNAQVEADALRNLPDADLHDAALQSKPLRQHRQKGPGIKAVEEHLKDAVDGDQASDVIRVAFRQFVPDQHHRNAAGDADQDQAAHIGRFAAQEDDGEEKHQHRADEPVLHQRQTEHALVAEDLAQLLVAHLRQRREHHDDQADGDGNIRRAGLKAIDEGRRATERSGRSQRRSPLRGKSRASESGQETRASCGRQERNSRP